MATEIYRKKGDTAKLKVTLIDDNGAIDLTSASVVFTMTSTAGTVKVNKQACALLDQTQAATRGQVTYAFTSQQVNTSGKYYGEWQITFQNGDILTVPSAPDPYVFIIIKDTLV
jgi:hypothetical protein